MGILRRLMFWRSNKPNTDKLFIERVGQDKDSEQRLFVLARHIVLNDSKTIKGLRQLDGNGITAESRSYVHIIATNTRPLTLAIVRQALLLCHFPNFHDDSPENRTRVTFLLPSEKNEGMTYDKLPMDVSFFGNLMKYSSVTACSYSCDENKWVQQPLNSVLDSFVDVEFNIVFLGKHSADSYLTHGFTHDENAIVTLLTNEGELQDSITHLCPYQHYSIPKNIEDLKLDMAVDVTRAQRMRQASVIYGRWLPRINTKNINNIEKHIDNLNTILRSCGQNVFNETWQDLKETEFRLSNLFCSDCYEYRLRSVEIDLGTSKKQKAKKAQEAQKAVNVNIEDLSRTEHTRWCVERLILNYRPYTPEERYYDEILFGEERKSNRNKLKKAPTYVHVDLCSWRTLRRIDPDTIKYDIFFMLAIPEIMFGKE